MELMRSNLDTLGYHRLAYAVFNLNNHNTFFSFCYFVVYDSIKKILQNESQCFFLAGVDITKNQQLHIF
jgi:hypothetical protein